MPQSDAAGAAPRAEPKGIEEIYAMRAARFGPQQEDNTAAAGALEHRARTFGQS